MRGWRNKNCRLRLEICQGWSRAGKLYDYMGRFRTWSLGIYVLFLVYQQLTVSQGGILLLSDFGIACADIAKERSEMEKHTPNVISAASALTYRRAVWRVGAWFCVCLRHVGACFLACRQVFFGGSQVLPCPFGTSFLACRRVLFNLITFKLPQLPLDHFS